jgi:hypothetical protein
MKHPGEISPTPVHVIPTAPIKITQPLSAFPVQALCTIRCPSASEIFPQPLPATLSRALHAPCRNIVPKVLDPRKSAKIRGKDFPQLHQKY